MSERPLTILQLASSSSRSGELGHVVSLCSGLLRRGHRVLLGARTRRKGKPFTLVLEQVQEIRGLEVVRLALEGGFRPWADVPDVRRLRALLVRERVDVVHAHRGKEHWLALLAVRGTRVPLVRTRHVVTPVRRHILNRWQLRHTDVVIATATPIAQQLRAAGPEADVRLMHGGIDTGRFFPGPPAEGVRAELGAAPGVVVVGAVGRATRVKGYDVLLRAMERVHAGGRNVHALLALPEGTSDRGSLEAQARTMHCPVTLLGFRADLPEVYRCMDLAVISSLGSEGNSRAALEAMASGLPLVATRVGCLPDLVDEEERVGLLVPPGDEAALALAIGRLADDAPRRRAMGLAARALVERDYSLEGTLAAVERLYREALARRA